MDVDIRKDYIINTAANYFAIEVLSLKSYYENEDLNRFLDYPKATAISAVNDNGKLHFSEKSLPSDSKIAAGVLVFFKIYPTTISSENYHTNISIVTMMSDPLKTLYYSLQRIYAPLIVSNHETNINANILKQVKELEHSLHRSFFQEEWKPENESDILSIEDEISFWKNVTVVDKQQIKNSVKTAILEIMNLINNCLQSMNYSVVTEVEESIETIFNALDDLWKLDDYNYPETRMKIILDIIGNNMVEAIQEQLNDKTFLHILSQDGKTLLKKHILACEKFLDMCEKFSTFFWPNFMEHAWKSGVHQPAYLKGFLKRLLELQKVIKLHVQLSSIFTKSEKADLATDSYFKPFEAIKPYYFNYFTEPIWNAAVEGFYSKITPAEEKAAHRLQNLFQEIGTNIPQMFQELKHYDCLMERPSVKNVINAERQEMLQQILHYFSSLKPKTMEINFDVVETPELVKNIYNTRQILAKVSDISKLVILLFSDVKGYDEFISTEKEILKSIKEFEDSLFEEWKRKMLRQSMGIKTEESVVQFEHGKLMQVTFPTNLVWLIRETRQLYMLGLPVSHELMERAAQASHFMDQAKALNQIATFHNTIGDRMVNSQRAMMLGAAREFSRLVQSQSNNKITWGSGKVLTDYIKKLQSVADKLSMQNSRLVKYHKLILSKVIILMNTDLIKQKDIWKSVMREIRSLVREVEEEFSSTKHWCVHIDYQIYKAMEYQYELMLVKLNDALPEFQVELVFRNNKVEYNPSLYKIRRDYYKKVKNILAIPCEIQGIGDSTIYPFIIDHTGGKFLRVFSEAESNFKKLREFAKVWKKWVSLNKENIDAYMETNLLKADDWVRNFRASKFFGQQIAKLPSHKKIGPFRISIDGLRSSIESENRRYWGSLSVWLRASILKDVSTIESFQTKAQNILQHQPQKVEEITETSYQYKQIYIESDDISKILDELDEKNKLLRSLTKESATNVEEIRNSWANFKVIIANYNLIISKKTETLKLSLSSEEEILNNEMERFVLHWREFKPDESKLLELTPQYFKDNLIVAKERKQKWIKLLEDKAKLGEDLKKLGMEPAETADYGEIEKEIFDCEQTWSLLEEFNEGLSKLSDEEWIVIRAKAYSKTDIFFQDWKEKLKTLPRSAVTLKISQDINSFEEVLPILQYVRGETFTEQHWSEVFTVLNTPPKSLDKITYGDFLYNGPTLIRNLPTIQDINSRAANEVVIRQGLNELDAWEAEAKFNTYDHTDSKGKSITIIKDFKDIMNKVGDNQFLLQSIKGSTNLSKFADRIVLWEERLTNLDIYLHDLNQVQRKWAYLEPIFGSGALEEKRFDRIDKEWRYIMQQLLQSNFKVVSLTRINNISNTLQQLLQNLLMCQKTLQNYLEDKRLRFPRFYFINDDDLLEILGQSNKHNVIQTHLKKIFAGIHSVEIKDDTITTIFSAQGEAVQLSSPVAITTDVEVWLENLSLECQRTLKLLVIDCLKKPDPLRYPYQILCLAERITFTKNCEQAITSNSLSSFHAAIKAQKEEYIKQVLEWSGGVSTDNDNQVLELKLKALLLDTVYYLGVVESLISSKVSTLDDWHWTKILRFYCLENNEIVIRMVDAEFKYTYEYQGAHTKLVHTALTDKCYLTLTQAVSMGLGGNPYGPAGTGKTESVKALGALLGRQVLVFNCDEGLDVKSLTRIMVGLVKCGAWGCFDEFNRLEQTTLSLISSQIHIIQEALRTKSPSIVLLEKNVDVNHNAGIFITLNPAGKNYGGRQKLPENLKQLFRPVLMSKPDDVEIARVILLCEGFQMSDEIGLKLVTIFHFARKFLSNQHHYDFGLRAMKTVVGSCGTALRNYLSLNQVADKETEQELTVQAVRLNTLCKLTFTDCSRFEQLVKDVFPEIKLKTTGYDKIKSALLEACSDLKLTYNERQIGKCIELYEQLERRMGVVVVGPPRCGKSAIISIVKTALIKLGRVVRHDVISPKSMSRHQLLGQIDVDTRQWSDGVLTSIAQQVYNENQGVDCFIHCDGDVDPEWIESLNSVLDDNHLLTLPSGWRIQFGENVHFIFETHELSYASPATISRMGIILLSEKDLPAQTLVDSWIEKYDYLGKNFVEEYFIKVVNWLSENADFVVDIPLNSAVLNCLKSFRDIKSKTHFCSIMLNEFCGNLKPESKENFIKMVMDLTNEVMFGANHTFHSYYDENSDTLKEYVTNVEYTSKPLNKVFTPMMQYARDVIINWLKMDHPLVLLGPTGCGKNTILEHCFAEIDNVEVIDIVCSSYLLPQHLLEKLNQSCMVVTNSSKRIYRPKNVDKIIVHFSDVNVVKSDKYGTKILAEFLKQVVDHGGFYDNSNDWVGIENIVFAFSLISVGDLSPRFLSNYHIINLRHPTNNEMQEVYSTIMKKFLGNKNNQIVSSIIEVYDAVYKELNNSPHSYNFSQHEISKWCNNLQRYDLNSCTLNEVFLNEGRRIFGDKLFEDDEKIFEEIIKNEMKHKFEFDTSALNDIYFTSYKQESQEANSLIRIESKEWTYMIKQASSHLGGDNFSTLLTPDLLKLTSKIECALTEKSGHVLLSAKYGAGRKTALQIVAQRQNGTIFSPKLGGQYGVVHFQNDLKSTLQTGGINNEKVFLLIEDYQILHDEFLNLLNSLVSSGEVLGLYQPEEIDNVTAPLKPLLMEENYEKSAIDYFRERISRNVHVVLCFDYDDVAFNELLKLNPALLKLCYRITIENFSLETMYAIPNELLERDKRDDVSQKKIIEKMIKIHVSARKVVKAPPIFYFYMIQLFITLQSNKNSTLLERKERLEAGISKITEAQNVVEKLKGDANEQKALLDEKQLKGKQVLDQISETMANASLQRNDIEQLRLKTEEENRNLQIRKKEIDKELSFIEPLIKEAQAAVGNIKNESLSEIRSLRAPPVVIRDILEGVLRLMGIQDTSWNSMKTFLAKRGVKEEIRSFDASQITIENRDAVEQLLSTNGSSFESRNAKRASVAAAPLASWVKANVEYSKVIQKIQPLEKEQSKLQRNLEAAELQMQKLGSGLSTVDAVVAKLKEQLSSSTKEAAEIEVHLKNAQSTILAAEGLVTKLEAEFKIWVKQLSELSSTLDTLMPDCLLAAAIITYLSQTPKKLRQAVINNWKEMISCDENFSVLKFLSTERQMLQWSSEGLPDDEYSQQNAIIILNVLQSPLLLDPALIATNWLKQHFAKEQVEVIAQHSPNFITKLELAVRFGKIVIVEDIQQIHPVLQPILKNNFIQQGTRRLVYIGPKLVDYHMNFKLFLTSRSIGLEASKKLKVSLPILNFGATTEGLTQQLLGCALKVEKPMLEKRRVELLHEEESLKSRLYFLQEKVLEELASSQGDILQNQELLASLNNTKESSIAIVNSLQESLEIKKDMMKECEVYMPLSEYGTKLFFACFSLSNINNMYYISVATFFKLFEKSISSSEDLDLKQKFQHLLATVYNYISRSMFKSDRLAFALHLVHGTLPHLFAENEWEYFTDQNVDALDSLEKFEVPKWVQNDRVHRVKKLNVLLPTLYEKLKLENETLWMDFMSNPSPQKPSHCELSPFQFILVTEALRPDTLHSCLIQFALSNLGISSLSPGTLQLNDLLIDSSSSVPFLIITSPGNDPSKELTALANNKMIKCIEMVVGPGQEEEILSGLSKASKAGHWIILKNLHLLINWLPTLEKTIQELKPVDEFRLWLVTEPHIDFSPTLLSLSQKITYEAPPGVKKNMERTYNEWNSTGVLEATLPGSQTMFVAAWFHAIIQERRTYIPQGWTSYYEFNDNDLSVAVNVIKKRLKDRDIKQQWDYIHGLFELTIYGGRVNNIYDLRVLSSFLLTLFNSNVVQTNGLPLAPGVEIPSSSDIKEHFNIIRKLPEGDKPEYFGLPKNVARVWQRVTSSSTVSMLKDLDKFTVIGDTIGMSKYSHSLTSLIKLWKQLNQRQGLIYGEKPLVDESDDPIVAFFALELSFAIDLVTFIHTGIVELTKIIKLGIFSNKSSKDMANSILIDEVPEEFEKIWSGPSNPKDYIRSVIRRALKIQSIQKDLKSINESPIDLNDLFNVESFIMALRQQGARKLKVSIEKMELVTDWKSSKGNLLNGHASITGVFLEGALMKEYRLVECTEESASVIQAPPFVLSWQTDPYANDFSRLSVPLYSSEKREKLFAELTVPCLNEDKNRWIKSSVTFYIFSSL